MRAKRRASGDTPPPTLACAAGAIKAPQSQSLERLVTFRAPVATQAG
jgi:hypothetical protein